jgi:hypothetical protein
MLGRYPSRWRAVAWAALPFVVVGALREIIAGLQVFFWRRAA